MVVGSIPVQLGAPAAWGPCSSGPVQLQQTARRRARPTIKAPSSITSGRRAAGPNMSFPSPNGLSETYESRALPPVQTPPRPLPGPPPPSLSATSGPPWVSAAAYL
uniref:Uncharacterized protein n=1 Tax=Knipowitschia caucasica TaxID=637954 RepID=A0AAV2M8Q9_KNICA